MDERPPTITIPTELERADAFWYLFALAYIPAIKLTVALVHRLATGAWPRFGDEPWYGILAAIAFSTPFQAGEEIGGRGYALPRLATDRVVAVRDGAGGRRGSSCDRKRSL